MTLVDPRIAALTHAVEYIYGARVPGDLIEFGVKDGDSARIILNAMRAGSEPNYTPDMRDKRTLWLCDSFEGFPETTDGPDLDSYMIRSGVWGKGQSRGCSADRIRGRFPECRVVEGWYRDVWRQFAVPKYALIHADCDLYQSTWDALYPLFADGCVSEGAIILFDDWNGNQARPEFGQQRAWRELQRRFMIDWSDEGAYGAFGHKVIVHDYSVPHD
jgi:hypothetical protein